jgi:two-component system, NtrC family, response regulator AtoC
MSSLLSTTETSFVASVSPAMVTLEAAATEIAGTNIPILVLGEIGTGKELFARRIHDQSAHRAGPFARIACASVTSDRFLDEPGLREALQANGASSGTLLLDEVSELDAACQRKLLYSLPDGDGNPNLKARIISTSRQNLEDEMRAGRFRSDLYYRLNAVCLRLLPLRERKSDIPALVEHFLAKHASEFGKPVPGVSAHLLESFINYSWPGNVRELENAVQKFVALNDESLAVADFGAPVARSEMHPALTSYSLKAVARAASRGAERELILKTLARTRWNRKRAAQVLQISYKSLLYKLKQIGLEEREGEIK